MANDGAPRGSSLTDHWVETTTVTLRSILPYQAGERPYSESTFYRVERARSRQTEGAGIGLVIVRELVEARRGQVGASSEDGWARVWIELPGDLLAPS